MVEFGIYLPQLAFTTDQILDRAAQCEELGFASLWLMDHLYPPELPGVPSLEGWTLATWLLARTTRLRVGHLVLSNTFRHPVVLAKMATSLDVLSGGRLDLGVGSGSYGPEHAAAGIPFPPLGARSAELDATLATVKSMFAGDGPVANLPPPVQTSVHSSASRPGPPIHIGGANERHTLPIVARHADVWNCPASALGAYDQKWAVLERLCAVEGRDPAELRVSQQAVLVLAPTQAAVAEATALAERRYGGPGWGLHAGGFIGTPDAVIRAIQRQVERGVDLIIFATWDRAGPETLRLFADEVLPAF
jgi:alkanesulfonate monooxygenase SsuD/methylene tetrahydromethanopterin reductase-like flavin-dependent oxidoreductase (luciferase family)